MQNKLNSGRFHIDMLQYLKLYTTEEELAKLDDKTVLHLSADEGRYDISYEDLKKKADKETLGFLDEKNLELTKEGEVIKKQPVKKAKNEK
jgi:hypothetical protein